MRIWITGMGCISALGNTVSAQRAQLNAQQDGLGPIRQLSTRHAGRFPVGEVPYSNADLKAWLPNLPPKQPQSRTSLLGMIAAQEAWQQAGAPALNTGRTGVFSGNTVGGMDRTEQFWATQAEDDPQVLKTHSCGDSTQQIANYLGATGVIATVNTACSSAANAILIGARWLQSGRIDRAVVGGTDALTQFTVNGFHSLQLLDEQPARPFDATRQGLNLGEGAGFLILETQAAPERRLAELVGYANSNDAYHATASSPEGEGAYRAMQGALEKAGLIPSDIDYINVHGTGTLNNDVSEGRALQRLFGHQLPPFSSTKPYIGHTLGAAGGIEAVFSILALQEQEVFPNLNLKHPIAVSNATLTPVTTKVSHPIQYVLSNSLGFGGNSTALIFKTPTI